MIIWITGAGSGIGLATARYYAAQGHQVAVSARNEDSLNTLKDSCKGQPGEIHVFQADVCRPSSLKAAYKRMLLEVGLPDLALLNAGTYEPSPAADFRMTPYQRLMEINYFGTLNCLNLLLPDFKDRGKGQIALMASMAGFRGLPNASAYGASKAAVINLAESLKPELASFGIDLRLINPGFVKTPLTDKNTFAMPFLIPAEQAARTIADGLAGRSFDISFPFTFALMMKLLRLLPDRLYFLLTRRLIAE
ncbi:SDR family NAD(P)-dependent oxidoreductase [Rhodovibrionaceae bacterium A322]